MSDESPIINDETETASELSSDESKGRAAKSAPKSETMRILESLLFASGELLTPARLKEILPDKPDARIIRKMIDTINAQLQQERHPFEIVELGGGYQFRTISYYQPWVSQLFKEKTAKKLSIQSLECLAIIAYKQPITKAQVEEIRGVVSDGAMKTLLEKHLVTIVGRSEKAGRPLLYGTTTDFLKYFGFNKLADLPRIEEFEAIAKEKMDEMGDEELVKEEIEIETAQNEIILQHQAELIESGVDPDEVIGSVPADPEAATSEDENRNEGTV